MRAVSQQRHTKIRATAQRDQHKTTGVESRAKGTAKAQQNHRKKKSTHIRAKEQTKVQHPRTGQSRAARPATSHTTLPYLGDLPLERVLEGVGQRLEKVLVVLFSLLDVRSILVSEAETLFRHRLQPGGHASRYARHEATQPLHQWQTRIIIRAMVD